MGKDPAVLFYTADFLVGTMKMNYAQKGRYIQLLCLQHQDGHLSEDDMNEICGGYDEKIFCKFVKDEDGKYYNERMEKESIKRRKFVESRQKNLSNPDIKNDKVSHKELHISSHMGNHTESRMENENINDNIISNIYLYWNSKDIIKHRVLSKDIKTAIQKALKCYSEEEIKIYIERYAKVIADTDYFWHYKWRLTEFLSRKDGISSFMDEGSKWINYCSFIETSKGKTKQSPKQSDKHKYGNFDPTEAFRLALERSNNDE